MWILCFTNYLSIVVEVSLKKIKYQFRTEFIQTFDTELTATKGKMIKLFSIFDDLNFWLFSLNN